MPTKNSQRAQDGKSWNNKKSNYWEYLAYSYKLEEIYLLRGERILDRYVILHYCFMLNLHIIISTTLFNLYLDPMSSYIQVFMTKSSKFHLLDMHNTPIAVYDAGKYTHIYIFIPIWSERTYDVVVI